MTLCSKSSPLIEAIVCSGKSPDSLTFRISAPMRTARLMTSARGMTLSDKIIAVMVPSCVAPRPHYPLDQADQRERRPLAGSVIIYG